MGLHETIKEEILAPLVDELMATEYAVAPPNPLVSPKAWKEQKRKELLDLYSSQKEIDRISSAVAALRSDFEATLSPIEFDKYQEEWENGVKRMLELFNKPLDESMTSLPLTSLKEMMNLSEPFLELLYSAGVKHYQSQDFVKSADIFFLLSQIDCNRYNVWISLGLSEMKITQFEPALNAFAMASLIRSTSPYPYLYSAECCIELGKAQDCGVYIDLAKEAANSLQPAEKETVLSNIRFLQQKTKI